MVELNTLILHEKIYTFTEYIYPILKNYPTYERYSLETYIRNTLYNMLEQCIRYMHSGTMSHLYTIDANLALLRDFFKLSRDVGIKCINANRILVITSKLDEIGRILGGVIRARQGKIAKQVKIQPISFFDYEKVVVLISFYQYNYIPDYMYMDQVV